MRQDSKSTRSTNPFSRLSEASPEVRHIPGFAFTQISVERDLRVSHTPAFDQEASEMRAAHQIRIRDECDRAFQRPCDADFLKSTRDERRTAIATAAVFAQAFDQRRIARIDVETDDVERMPMPAYGNFDAVDEAKAFCIRCGARFSQTADIVVIGQGERTYAALRGAVYDRLGPHHAVGTGGVAVKVEV